MDSKKAAAHSCHTCIFLLHALSNAENDVQLCQISHCRLLQRLANVMAACCMCRGGPEEEKEVAWFCL